MPSINWEAVGAVAQLLGDIVVAITLVYLAAQVRQGNRVARQQVRQRMIEQAERELYAQMADPGITYANVKNGGLSEDEQAKLALFLIAFMRQREWEWFQLRDGAIGKDVYEAYQQVIAIHLGTQRGRKWWNAVGRSAFNPDFVGSVDELLARTSDSTYLRDMRIWDNAAG
jgi:hypothetical protein